MGAVTLQTGDEPERRRPASGLLLDVGGVVVRNGTHLFERLAQRYPAVGPVVERVGGLATERDELWQRMLRGEVTERAYWAQRSAELGEALGEQWDTRAMIVELYDVPREEWLVGLVVDLMTDVRAAGLPLGALTNDLADFHGQEWVEQQGEWLGLFDVVVDASHTGVMKPDPRAFRAGAEALGLPPEEIVYLDDMPWNVAGGLAAGLQAVQVSHTQPEHAVAVARERLGLGPRGPRAT